MAQNLNHAITGSKCYGNSETNCATYGRLYDWNAAMTACPDDWHLPTNAEWTTLINYAGGSSTAGTKLKATSGWTSGNGTDTLGFSALPGGTGNSGGDFGLVGAGGYWWSSEEVNYATGATYRMLNDNGNVSGTGAPKEYLYSVRCIQNSSPGTFHDSRDEKVYKKVKIGSQVWMAQNLNYAAPGSKCYNDSIANCEKYGRLYNWSTAMASSASSASEPSGVRGVCPYGWHLPSNAEWGALMQSVNPSCSLTGDCANAGTELKATSGWTSGNGVDSKGFSALPGGSGNSSGSFGTVGDFGYWWSATADRATSAYFRGMDYGNENVYYGSGSNGNLLSIRCVQD
jgi:uncharacterized protein (TIGR02145 family)